MDTIKTLPEPYYRDDLVSLYLGDARTITSALAPGSIDMIFTDPPYGHNNNNNGDLAHRWEAALGIHQVTKEDARPIQNDDPTSAREIVRWLFAESARLLKPGACCCCCCCGGGPDPQFARWSLWLDEVLDFKQMVVWDKGGLGMGWHYRRCYETVLVGQKPGARCRWFGGHSISNVVRLSGIKPRASDHPTPKPVALPEKFIAWHSVPGDLILDPLTGGGSTLVAAKRTGRRAIGIEIEERWCALTAQRLRETPAWQATA